MEGTQVHIGVPVLRRYDLLRLMLQSAAAGSVVPVRATVVDNGLQSAKVSEAIAGLPFPVDVYRPDLPLGVAESWNWLVAHMPEERIIANDDVEFTAEAIRLLCETPGDLVFGHGYSCYLLRDSAFRKVGQFDEAISPGYAYWEDIDYDMRVRLFVASGGEFLQQNAPCEVRHAGSQTNKWATPAEIAEHHRRFNIAKNNMVRKYAHLPYDQQHPALRPHLQAP
jgi:hypothetical protein